MSRRTLTIAIAAAIAVVAIAVPLVLLSRQTPTAPATAMNPAASATTHSTPASTSAPASTPSAAATVAAAAPPCSLGPGSPPTATLAVPFATAMQFAPNGSLFIAERSGTVAIANGNQLTTFAHVATVTAEPDGGYSERGLLGLALSPQFATDHYVYAFYDLPDYSHENIVRWVDCSGQATDFQTIASFPAGTDCCHKGGRLAFGPDGKLYATLGEEHVASAAQNTGDPRGKVLRMNADGSMPSDNPFGNLVWAYGLRNPFGIAFGADGTLLVTSNGPSGDAGSPGTGYDVALTVTRGAHLQWPNCYGYSHQNSGWPPCSGMQGPVWSSEHDTVVPTGATWVDAQGPAGYASHFVFCSYEGGGLILTLGSPGAVNAGPPQCRFAIAEGPDHALYFSNETDIYRLG